MPVRSRFLLYPWHLLFLRPENALTHGHAMDATLMFSAPATPPPASAAHASALANGVAQSANGVEQPADPGRPANTPNGRLFAGLMRGLLPTHERQEVAAAAPAANTEPGELKTEVLGDQLHLITTNNAQPDPNSLTAFARAQGLDEAAVKALFGELAAQEQAKSGSPQGLPAISLVTDTGVAPTDVAWLASQLSAEISVQVSEGHTAQVTLGSAVPFSQFPFPITTAVAATATAMAAASDTAMATATAMAAASDTASTAANGETDLNALMGWNMMVGALPVMTRSMTMPVNALPQEDTLSVSLQSDAGAALDLHSTISPLVTGTAILPPLKATAVAMDTATVLPPPIAPVSDSPLDAGVLGAQTAASSTKPTLDTIALQVNASFSETKPALNKPISAAEALNLLEPTTPKPEEAMRIRLVPAWSVVTQQLTQMSGTAMTSTWGALTAATLGAPTRSVALDLSTPLASDSEDGNSLNTTDGGWPGAAQDLNRPGAASTPLPGSLPTPGMAQTLRQEHYQQLADRLGQAMAERLQSQIARGEWKLQMRLNPANLGRIDVELDMHAKGLDAMFRSENPLTRELMVQSMPKLKDTLSQSGMAVASVWVNSDAGRQSDGNPTPQKDRTDVSDTPKSAQTDNGAAPAAKAQRSTDGFDVLA